MKRFCAYILIASIAAVCVALASTDTDATSDDVEIVLSDLPLTAGLQ